MRPATRLQRCVAASWLALLLLGLFSSAQAQPARAPGYRAIGVAEGLPSRQVNAIAQDHAGYLWLATADGLARFDGLRFTLWRQAAPGEPGLPGNHVGNVFVDAADRVWFEVEGAGRFVLGADRGVPRPATEAPDGWRAAVQGALPPPLRRWRDAAGGLWQAREGRLWRESAAPDAAAWPSPAWVGEVRAVFEDREGGLWFGTRDEGLLSLPAGWRSFAFVPGTRGDAAVPAGLAVAGAWAWWSDAAGLHRVDLGRGEAVAVTAGDGPVRVLAATADGGAWLGRGAGLWRARAEGRGWRLERVAVAPWPLVSLLATADDELWLVGEQGIEVRDRDAGRVLHALVSRGQVRIGPDGRPWRFDAKGWTRWSPADAAFVPVPGAPEGDWDDVVAEADGRLWAVRAGELRGWDWRGSRLRPRFRLGAADGVPVAAATRLARDARGALWLASARGLLRLDPAERQLRRFGAGHGLADPELAGAALVVAPGGVGVAATPRGLVLFDTHALDRRERAPPPLVFESLAAWREGHEQALPVDAPLLRLAPGDRDLRVVARLVSFAEPAAHRFRFRLEGYDADWVAVGAQGERLFPPLPPGSYRLQVAGALADGAWSEPRGFTLLVDPPWWRRPAALAAFALAGLAGLALLATVYRARLQRREAWRRARERQRLAEQNSEAKTRFLATLGHEIRTPMTGVLGMAELLQASELQPKQRAQVEAIQGAGRHLLRLVNDALDLARIEAGKLVLEDAPFDLQALLRELAGLLRPLAQAKDLGFALRCHPGTPAWLRGDATRVRQILLNLAGNAIKFCSRGGLSIDIAPRLPVGIVIEVRDTGPGLAAEQQARLFQRFEQGAAAGAQGRYGGSGLGLAISQELAAAMGGSIAVESVVGQGACFRVELPLPSAVVPSAPPPATRAPVAEAGRRVLLVEDDAVVAAVVRGLLEALGHEVVHAAHGLAALAELQAGRFDLALLDLDLPGLDGFELARLLRAQGHDLPLVALTARADGEAEPQAREAGMDGFLRKPVTGEMLGAVLARFAAGSRP